MALRTTQAEGAAAGPWVYNDFLDLLTGVMTDQPVTLGNAFTLSNNPLTLTRPLGGSGKTMLSISPSDGTKTWAVTFNPDNSLIFGTTTDVGIALRMYLTGAVDVYGPLKFTTPLSATTKLIDLLQGYALYSDNTATIFTGATTRLWFDAPDLSEFHIGPRSGATTLKGFRVRALNVIIDATNTNAEAAGFFQIEGGMKFSADAGKVVTDGNGQLTAVKVIDGSSRVAVQGPHSAGQTVISYCVGGPPAALAANEICVELT